MFAKRRVLIVNGSEESREVLKTALERRGMEILEATAATEGLALAHKHRPRVIVLDLEGEAADEEAVCLRFQRQSRAGHAALVVLANSLLCRAARGQSGSRAGKSAESDETGQFVAKPYHYGPLVRKIEELAG